MYIYLLVHHESTDVESNIRSLDGLQMFILLPLDEPVASGAVFFILSGSDGNAFGDSN